MLCEVVFSLCVQRSGFPELLSAMCLMRLFDKEIKSNVDNNASGTDLHC